MQELAKTSSKSDCDDLFKYAMPLGEIEELRAEAERQRQQAGSKSWGLGSVAWYILLPVTVAYGVYHYFGDRIKAFWYMEDLEKVVEENNQALDQKLKDYIAHPMPPTGTATNVVPAVSEHQTPPPSGEVDDSGFPWILTIGITLVCLAVAGGVYFFLLKKDDEGDSDCDSEFEADPEEPTEN